MDNLISVIIPVYNVEKYLKKCIESVLTQTYQNLQIILVDDGSTDSSKEICDNYKRKDKRVLVIHKTNGGLSSARNAGLKIATGDYITFLDSDDYILPTIYEELLSSIVGKDRAIACMNYKRVDEKGTILDRKIPHSCQGKTSNIEYFRELLLHTGDVSVCTKLFPKSIIKNTFFDEDKLNEDLLFMVSLIPKFDEIIYIGKVGYYYLIRKNSISSKYGKTVIDMAINAREVNDIIQNKYCELLEEGNRFALFQNMAYLLLVPLECRRNDYNYTQAIQYLRSNYIKKGIKNRYLGLKNKIIILGLLICPNLISSIFQKRKNKRVN